MGYESYLISKSTREGYELGKGPWYDDFFESIDRDGDLRAQVREFLDDEWDVPCAPRPPNVEAYLDEIAVDIANWMGSHPDWRYAGEDDEEYDGTIQLYDPNNPDDVEDLNFQKEEFGEGYDEALFKKTGSRYRDGAVWGADDEIGDDDFDEEDEDEDEVDEDDE